MPNPNPACSVGGVAPPVDLAANTLTNGALVSSAGANFWSVVCIATDESTTPATVNAGLVINQGPKTFQFTSGALGTAFIFRSTVGVTGLGLDANAIFQSSFSTTFKINVKAANGRRVLALNEAFEQDAINGWIAVVNQTLRS
jgi:hypothetical protein